MNILTIITHYLPGEKSGGAVRSVANIVDCFSNRFRFFILTKDRDLGDKSAYSNVRPSSWQNVNNALVWYMHPHETRLTGLWRLITATDYDLLYLNSLFSKFTIKILLLRAMGLLKKGPIVVAPRGELSPGALEIKSTKKRTYLLISKLAGFYRGVVWHASTIHEAEDIGRIFPWTKRRLNRDTQLIRIAPDPFLLPTLSFDEMATPPLHKEPGELRVVFISRISKKKNLDFAIRLLSELQGSIQFDIYGPCEDKGYWDRCKSLIKALPPNINVVYGGIARSDDVRLLFGRYHLFLFPTRGENFGHVIPEALSSGCLVLLSDQTPWRGLAQKGIGWDVGLDDMSGFKKALDVALAMDNVEFTRRSVAARRFLRDYYQRRMLELDNVYLRLFDVSPDNQA